MRHWILFAAVVLLSVLARGQERVASVQLTDGQRFTGRVVAMDLDHVQIAVEGKVLTIATKDMRSCEFSEVGEPGQPEEVAAAPEPSPAAVPDPAPVARAVAPGPAAASAPSPAVESAPRPSRYGWRTRLEAEAAADAAVVGAMGLLHSRVEAFASTYPWLFPSGTTQWVSIVLLLFAVLSLVIHSSARIVGAETVQFARSMGLALVYLAVGAAQFALLPANDLTVFSALIGNSAVVLFAVRKTFELPRTSTFIAVALQVGFLMLALSILQLMDSLLGSVSG